MRRRPGALERELVMVLAAAGGGLTTPQIHAQLGSPAAYTTVMTTLARLCDKGVLARTPSGRTYRYELVESPATMQAALTAHRMRALMDTHPDHAVVMSRFVDELDPADAALLADLLAESAEGTDGTGGTD